MKTINPEIDIFNTYEKALSAFNKSDKECHLLKSKFGYFVDRSKTALECWPKQYELIKSK